MLQKISMSSNDSVKNKEQKKKETNTETNFIITSDIVAVCIVEFFDAPISVSQFPHPIDSAPRSGC